jgi:excisionase family DNA binding protein
MPHVVLPSSKHLYSLKEFCLLTDLSLRTINKLIANGEIRSIRVGRRRLIPRGELQRFVRRDHLLKPRGARARRGSARQRKVGQ